MPKKETSENRKELLEIESLIAQNNLKKKKSIEELEDKVKEMFLDVGKKKKCHRFRRYGEES